MEKHNIDNQILQTIGTGIIFWWEDGMISTLIQVIASFIEKDGGILDH